MAKNNAQSNQNTNPGNEYVGIALAIVLLFVAAVLFFRWDMFGDSLILEFILKFAALPCALFGFVGIGNEISSSSDDNHSALNMGIGLGFVVSGMMMGFLPLFPAILNLLVLIVVGLGFIFIIVSIMQLLKIPKNDLSMVQRSIIVIGQTSGSILSLIELVSFLMGWDLTN